MKTAASRFDFRELHAWQAATVFRRVDRPPFERGVTWSIVIECRKPVVKLIGSRHQ